ncbi:MAG: hypothetical protein MHM6MM_003145 [Cercozoa sp. M6MM]
MSVVKLVLPTGEIRRISFDDGETEVEALVGPSFKLEYTDDENDVVTLGSASRDLDDALAVAAVMGKMLRLTVTCPPLLLRRLLSRRSRSRSHNLSAATTTSAAATMTMAWRSLAGRLFDSTPTALRDRSRRARKSPDAPACWKLLVQMFNPLPFASGRVAVGPCSQSSLSHGQSAHTRL